MARIYLLRHGESVANTEGRYQGQTYDTPLSTLGVTQARQLATYLGDVKFDYVFSSPLQRTQQTALFLGNPIFVNDIIETNHGMWEGRTKKEIIEKWPDLYDKWLTRPGLVQFPGGEHFQETFRRSINWFNSLSLKDENIAVVTHSNIICCYLSHVLERDIDLMWDFYIQPTSISLIEIEKGKRKVIYYCKTDHLEECGSDLSLQAI